VAAAPAATARPAAAELSAMSAGQAHRRLSARRGWLCVVWVADCERSQLADLMHQGLLLVARGEW
jgi:hypothetical protein